MSLGAYLMKANSLSVVLADMLVSWRVQSEVRLPTTETPKAIKGQGNFYAKGLVRKTAIVNKNISAVWAGDLSSANKVLFLIKDLFDAGKCDSLEALVPLLKRENKRDFDGFEMIVAQSGPMGAGAIGLNTALYELSPYKRIGTIGTGTASFIEAFSRLPPIRHDKSESGYVRLGDQDDQMDDRRIWDFPLKYMALAMQLQAEEGYGFNRSWGGSFDMILGDSNGWQRIKRVLIRRFSIYENEVVCDRGIWFFIDTKNEDQYFIATSNGSSGEKATFYTGELEKEQASVIPEWIVDVFDQNIEGRCSRNDGSPAVFKENVLKVLVTKSPSACTGDRVNLHPDGGITFTIDEAFLRSRMRSAKL